MNTLNSPVQVLKESMHPDTSSPPKIMISNVETSNMIKDINYNRKNEFHGKNSLPLHETFPTLDKKWIGHGQRKPLRIQTNVKEPEVVKSNTLLNIANKSSLASSLQNSNVENSEPQTQLRSKDDKNAFYFNEANLNNIEAIPQGASPICKLKKFTIPTASPTVAESLGIHKVDSANSIQSEESEDDLDPKLLSTNFFSKKANPEILINENYFTGVLNDNLSFYWDIHPNLNIIPRNSPLLRPRN